VFGLGISVLGISVDEWEVNVQDEDVGEQKEKFENSGQ